MKCPKENYLKRLQAVKKQFVWLKATKLDAVNGVSVMIVWILVAYCVSVATNQYVALGTGETWNSAPVTPKKCVEECLLPHQTNSCLFFLQILIIPPTPPKLSLVLIARIKTSYFSERIIKSIMWIKLLNHPASWSLFGSTLVH